MTAANDDRAAGPPPDSAGSWPSVSWSVLPRAFFDRPVLTVAPALLGCVLAHETDEGLVAVELAEVEAYRGELDPASHAFRGKTARNAVMFGEPGHAYVYFTYGMHFCVNLVCQPSGEAAAVLLRAGRVVEGAALATARRLAGSGASVRAARVRAADVRAADSGAGVRAADSGAGVRAAGSGAGVRAAGSGAGVRQVAERELARGPARLCQALAIGRMQNGADVCDPQGPLRVLAPAGFTGLPAASVSAGPRVGVRLGAEADWRFWAAGDPAVSAYRPHAPKRRAAAATGPGAEGQPPRGNLM
jgi:DNA-3-methyladenine glycosylase